MSTREDQFVSETRSARLIAVGNLISLQAAATEQSFATELERIVGMAVPHLARDRPNLVVLGEILGLPLALSGKRGYLSRLMHTSNVAISMLALGYGRRMIHYRRLYTGISLVRSLLLSMSDVMYRPFASTLSRLAARHSVYLSASTITPHVQCSTSTVDISHFGRRHSGKVFLPDGPGVYNTDFLWGPDGSLVGTTDKVFLTDNEKATLDLTAGNLDSVQVFETEIGKIGIAISLDAFAPEYLQRLDSLGACIVIQNDANDQPWAGPSKTCDWQPQEWLNSVLGSVQDDYPHLHYNICPMQVGNFFDVTFDGQSTITKKSDRDPDPYCNFVGNEGFVHTVTGKTMKGDILAVSPWVVEDPIRATPGMSLTERRKALEQVAHQLLPGGSRANQYSESVIWADVDVPVA
ncbi:MAG: nitrilase-related carbon-nitrogen hydrolase [Ktedonobacteraceae bacterium]